MYPDSRNRVAGVMWLADSVLSTIMFFEIFCAYEQRQMPACRLDGRREYEDEP